MFQFLSPQEIAAALRSSLPATFVRSEIPALTGGILCRGTLANLGKSGPPYLRSKRHAVYERETFLAWLIVYLGDDTPSAKGS